LQGLGIVLSVSARASTNVVMALARNQYPELIGGPAVVTTRQLGFPTTFNTPNDERLCGPPQTVEDCKHGGWMIFNWPRTFTSQGDAEQYVITGK
jgi:hypothetical protein